MIKRFRRWIDRRVQGVPTTPLSVLSKPPVNSGPWTIDRIERELRWRHYDNKAQDDKAQNVFPRHLW